MEDSSQASCPVCREELGRTGVVHCSACACPHHARCWQYNGGCARFGCGCLEFSHDPEDLKLKPRFRKPGAGAGVDKPAPAEAPRSMAITRVAGAVALGAVAVIVLTWSSRPAGPVGTVTRVTPVPSSIPVASVAPVPSDAPIASAAPVPSAAPVTPVTVRGHLGEQPLSHQQRPPL